MDNTNNEDAADFAKKMACVADERIAFNQINDIFNEKISSFGLDELRERGKENNMTSLTKYNKPEMRDMLVAEFQRNWDVLKDTKLEELRVYARENKVVGFSTAKKNELIVLIMTKVASCEERQFAATGLTKLKQSKTIGEVAEGGNLRFAPPAHLSTASAIPSQPSLIYKLVDNDIGDKQKLTDTENTSKEDVGNKQQTPKVAEKKISEEKKAKQDDAAEKQKQEEVKKQQEEADRQKEEDRQRNEDLKRKKQSIPKSVRTHVWDLYIGSNINEHRCICCKKTLIKITNFDVGHVMSERDGGTLEISNLRPICSVCNHSMGCTNMVDFVKKYGYYIG